MTPTPSVPHELVWLTIGPAEAERMLRSANLESVSDAAVSVHIQNPAGMAGLGPVVLETDERVRNGRHRLLAILRGRLTVRLPVMRLLDRPVRTAARKHPRGPGTCLHGILARWLGIEPTAGCGCSERIRQMNRWGAIGCRENLPKIVEWLYWEAKKGKWWKYAAAVPGARQGLRLLVLQAIREAEADQARFAADIDSEQGGDL